MPFEPFADWRVWPTSTLAKDVPDEGPGKPAYKAGAVIVPINPIKGKRNERMVHHEFIPIALSLDIAMSAADAARQHLSAIEFDEYPNGQLTDRHVRFETTDQLLAYFEHSMIAAAFSMQAIEMFCNDAIEHSLTKPYALPGRNGPKFLMPAAVQREASTDRKLLGVLPDALGIKPPDRKSAVWQDYHALKKFRNDVIHPKGDRQLRPRARNTLIDDTTIWHDLWNVEVTAFPRAAVAMIAHFTPLAETPRWLQHCLDCYGIERTRLGHRTRQNHLETIAGSEARH
jgi:hypothetical protein